MKKSNKNIIAIISIILIAIIIITTAMCLNVENKSVEVENTDRIQKREMNPDNYTMVRSQDGIDVPVPKGYTASSIEGEMCVNGEFQEESVNWYEINMLDTLADFPILEENLEMDLGERFELKKGNDGIWVSGNTGVSNSISEAITDVFTIDERGGKVTVSFAVSSESNDFIWGCLADQGGMLISGDFEIMVSGTECGTVEGELQYIEKEIEITDAGNYMLAIGYSKNESGDEGLDKAYIKEIRVKTQNSQGLKYPIVSQEKEVLGVEQAISGGFVIYEGDEKVTEQNKYEAQATRNQYVWIPIADVKDMYWVDEETDKLYGTAYVGDTKGYRHRENRKNEPQLLEDDIESRKLTYFMGGISRFEYLQEMEQDFYEMLQSVATYGGFYIGRYEVGNVSPEVDWENETYFPEKELEVKRFSNITTTGLSDFQIKLYRKSKNMSANNPHVETHIIWGTQYDQVLKWIIDTGAKTNAEVWKDATNWGYYGDAGDVKIYTYDNLEIKVTVETIDEDNPQITFPTGSCEEWKANNIYDLAGNAAELTMEAGTKHYNHAEDRFFRGRPERDFSRVYAEDMGSNLPASGPGWFGARTTLYIK